MKKTLSIIFFVLTLFVSFSLKSQNPDRLPVFRERIVQAKLRELRLFLNLDQATFIQLRPVYLKYEREISRINFRTQANLMKVNSDSLSAEQADQLISLQFMGAKRLIHVREKYYQEFRKVLTPQQIIKLYQSEGEVRKKVMAEKERRMLNR